MTLFIRDKCSRIKAMLRLSVLFLCLFVLLALCAANNAFANNVFANNVSGNDASGEVRRYVDKKGNVHLTDKEGKEAPAGKGARTDAPSPGTMYQYLDEHGRMHLTNDKGRILPQYMDSVKEIKGIARRSESFSGKIGDAFSGNRENAWLKYKQLGWFEKNALIARAGLTDIKGMFDDLKTQLLFITILFIGLGVFAIMKLRKVSHMVPVIVLLMSCYGMVYLSMHIKSSMGRGTDILSNLRQIQSLAQGQGSLTGGDMSIPSGKGGEDGIVDRLRQLQSMNSERQYLFRMILEED